MAVPRFRERGGERETSSDGGGGPLCNVRGREEKTGHMVGAMRQV